MQRPTPILGNPIRRDEHYTIVGAGISGLMMGFFLKEAGVSFEIHESSNRVGGLIDTIDGKYGLVETGANGILWCREIDFVAKRLGLLPLKPNQLDKKRFFVRDKELKQFPLTIWEMLGFAGRLLTPHRGDFQTIAEFGNAYMGAAATQQILSPALSGIYGTPAERLSFRGSAKMLSALLDRSRWLPLAIFKNYWANRSGKNLNLPKGLHSFEGGMNTLVLALAEHLKDQIKLNRRVDRLDSDCQYVVCTPARVAARLMQETALSSQLLSIDYQSLRSVSLFFREDQFLRFRPGFGCLIPRGEGLKSLGILFTSIIYPDRIKDRGIIALRCILHEDEDTRSLSPDEFQSLLEREVDQLFGLEGRAHDIIGHSWDEGLPIYNTKLYDLLPDLDRGLKSECPNIRLFGNYSGEISVRGACQSAFSMYEGIIASAVQ